MTAGPIRDIASFAEALRARGMTVTPDQMSDMARSLTLVDSARRGHVYAALRALAITDPNHRIPFDEEFRRFFDNLVARPDEDETQSRLAAVSGVKPIIQNMNNASFPLQQPRYLFGFARTGSFAYLAGGVNELGEVTATTEYNVR